MRVQIFLLAAAAVLFAEAAAPTHYDATRIYKHANDNGQDQGNGGDPGTYGFKDPAQGLNPKTKGDTQRMGGSMTTLAEALMMTGTDGFTAVTLENNPSSVMPAADIGRGVVGSDTGSSAWYFMAPTDRFSGDLSAAYNGKLSFTLVHAETPSMGKVTNYPDVVLEAKCGHSLQLYNFATKGGDLSIMLNEDAGWIDSRTKKAPSALDVLGVLSHLSAVKIRGGYYGAAESTRISSLKVVSGKKWYPCCTIDGTVDICQKKPSSYYNPDGLKFYCEGHMYRPVKVTRVIPRFSRRTGGATITVMGENFGLTGSKPIVRVNGRACTRTMFAPSVVRDQSNAADTGTANMFALAGTGIRVVMPSNPAGNALMNAYSSATDSMKQQYPEHCWNGMQDDGTNTGYNYGTATSAKYINQGETGVDTGGPCFPAHCSSCPVGNAGAFTRCDTKNQIVAVSSGTCKGRGGTALCDFKFPYLKYPALCPDDMPFKTTLKQAFTASLTSPSGTILADERRTLLTKMFNKNGMYATLDKKHMITEGMTKVIYKNPAMDSSLPTATSSKLTSVEVADAVALCGMDIYAINSTIAVALDVTEQMSEYTVTMLDDPTDQPTNYFHSSNFGSPSTSNYAYIKLGNEIMRVKTVANKVLTIDQRGSFGTPVSQHPIGTTVKAVEVCKNAAISFAPAAKTGNNYFITALTKNAVCHGFDSATAYDGRHCTLTVDATGQLLNKLAVGDVVRRIATGRTRVAAGSPLAANGGTLTVESAAELMGVLTSGSIACGADTNLTVTAVSLATNQLTLVSDSVSSSCAAGSIVTLTDGDSLNPGPNVNTYTTGIDVLAVSELISSDVQEFTTYRYLKIDKEIMRILSTEDAVTSSSGSERLIVARAQLGTVAAAHAKGATVELLPRVTEISAAVTSTGSTIYFPTAQDIIGNNIGPATLGSGLQAGGSVKAAFIKIDDEIMKVTAISRNSTQTAYAEVLRAQQGTLATPHAAGAPVFVMSCMDNDETGNNCGGSCKPCSAPSKGGPVQHDMLVCVTPAGDSGEGSAGQGADDVAVTVEAAPGPKESPFNQRMKSDMTGWLSMESSSESCISEQNRGFQYGAHDFVWGVHFKSDEQPLEVMVTDMTIDRNTGESYVVGTMQGKVTVQGKHVAMNGALDGRLSVTPAQVSYLTDSVETNAAATTLVLKNGDAAAYGDGDLVDARIKLLASSGDAQLYGCTGTVASYVNDTRTLTLDSPGLTRTKDATCATGVASTTEIRIYFGKSSFIAKLGRDGRTIWLNKLDTTVAGGNAVINSVAMDPGSAKIYVAGYYSDGRPATTVDTTLNIYSVDTTTRVASSSTAATINLIPQDSYGQVSSATTTEGNDYQEGFLISYTAAGAYEAHEVIKGKDAGQQLNVYNLKVKTYHPTTSNIINTQILSGKVPQTGRTAVTRNDVEYDRGMITAAGTLNAGRAYSSVTLATSAASYFQASGQTLTGQSGSAMDNWYNGLKITITCGKGLGQTRTIIDYDAATRTAYVQPRFEREDMVPDTTSCYIISGKPTSFVKGVHYASGGIYVAGTATSKTDHSFMCFGQLPDAYKEGAAVAPLCAQFSNVTGGEEAVNFVAQYDKDLKVYWARFIYDKAGSTTESGEIKGIAAVDDLVIVTGTFGYHATRTDEVEIAIQNCTFDTDTVSQGPPENTQSTVPVIKKLCRTQVVNLVDIGLYPMQAPNPQVSGSKAQTGQVAASQSYTIRDTVPADYINVSTGYTVVSSSTKQYMYVAAFDGSGACRWFHYVAGTTNANGNIMITPSALTHVTPAIGDKPLTGYWKTLYDNERVWKSRGQPPDATSAKDTSSEKFDTAVIKAGYIYVAGSVKTNDASSYADFGVTKYPLECSMGKTIGAKDSDISKLKDAQCAGKVVSSSYTQTDIFVAKYTTLGAARSDMTMTTYGSGRQPELQYIRRTGASATNEVATGLVVHDLTASIYVTGTYTSASAATYQGSDEAETTKFEGTEGNDGGYTITPTLASGNSKNSGADTFGLQAAGRVNALGCPRQRAGPSSTHEEKLGLTGVPDCTMYSHAPTNDNTLTTGFVVKFSDNGDDTQRGNKNRKTYPSITGFVQAGSTTTIAPCDTTNAHVLTDSNACSTSASGCSCLLLVATSKTSGTTDAPASGTYTANSWSGMKIKIVSGKGAGYEGIISHASGTASTLQYFTIPALSVLPDESSTFQIYPWAELNPKLHKQSCTATEALTHGCQAYGIEWAKAIGWPVGQTKVTKNAYGGPSDVLNGDTGSWQQPTAGSTSTATTLELNLADAVTSTTFYNNYIIYLSQSTVQPYVVTAVAQVVSYAVPTSATSGGVLTISCPAIAAGCPVLVQASGHRYKLEKIKATTTSGLPSSNESKNSKTRQTSTPQAIVMQDSDVYITGTFKGFDQHPFGIEGVDETVGYKSVGDDTAETYLVKLQD